MRNMILANLPLGVDVDNIHVLQLLKNVTGYCTTAFAEMWRTASVPLASTIDPAESTNT